MKPLIASFAGLSLLVVAAGCPSQKAPVPDPRPKPPQVGKVGPDAKDGSDAGKDKANLKEAPIEAGGIAPHIKAEFQKLDGFVSADRWNRETSLVLAPDPPQPTDIPSVMFDIAAGKSCRHCRTRTCRSGWICMASGSTMRR